MAWRTPLREWQKTLEPNPVSLTRDYITDKVASLTPCKPQFWLIPFLLSSAFYTQVTTPKELVQSFAWSNFYKFSKQDGLPTQDDLSRLSSNSCSLLKQSANWLREEINILRPHLVVLGIADKWADLATGLGVNYDHSFECPLRLPEEVVNQMALSYRPNGIWVTRHFTSWTGNLRHGGLLLEMKAAMSDKQI